MLVELLFMKKKNESMVVFLEFQVWILFLGVMDMK